MASGSSILSLTGYPEKFLKTKEQENAMWQNPEELARELPLTIQFPGWGAPVGTSLFLDPLSHVPCPASRTFSRDVAEQTGNAPLLESGGAGAEAMGVVPAATRVSTAADRHSAAF